MSSDPVQAFVQRWAAATASERANSQLFLSALCDLLAVSRPEPTPQNGYAFEFPVTEQHVDGTVSGGRIDLYKRSYTAPAAATFKSNGKQPRPKNMAERVKAVSVALSACKSPVTPDAVSKGFARARPADISQILETLVTMGHAHRGAAEGTYLP